MQPTLILLGGGRGNWPNFWSVLAYPPARVILLAPEGDPTQTSQAVDWLRQRGIEPEVLPPVVAWDAAPTRRICSQVIEASGAGTPVLINATQCPKPMAIGACQAAWRAQREEVAVFYLDTARGCARSFALRGELPPPTRCEPTLEDYLAAFGRQAVRKDDLGPLGERTEELTAVARQLATGRYSALLAAIRRALGDERSDDRLAVPWVRPTRTSRELLESLEQAGLVTPISTWTEGFRLTSAQAGQFLTGGWLELHAYACARDSRNADTERPEFCDVRRNLEIRSRHTTYELDLVALDPHGMLLYASCKSAPATKRGSWRMDYLEEVVDRAQLLGGSYCAQVLILGVPGFRVPENFRRQAEERRIELVVLEQLPVLAHRLTRAMRQARDRAR